MSFIFTIVHTYITTASAIPKSSPFCQLSPDSLSWTLLLYENSVALHYRHLPRYDRFTFIKISLSQTVPQDNNIKANLKSNIIIELLLSRFPDKMWVFPRALSSPAKVISSPAAQGLSTVTPPPNSSRQPPLSTPIETPNVVAGASPSNETLNKTDELPSRPLATPRSGEVNPQTVHQRVLRDASRTPSHISLRHGEADPISDSDSYILNHFELQYPPSKDPPSIATSASTYTFGTPASSRECSPAPQAPSEELRKAVELMAAVHSDDAQIREEILACREVAAKARKQAAALKSRAAAAKAVRERVQKYAMYWRWISPSWTFEEVWKGKITVRRVGLENIEITSSDDEQMEAMANRQEEEEEKEEEARSEQLHFSAFALPYAGLQ